MVGPIGLFVISLVLISSAPSRLLSQELTRSELGLATSVLPGNRSSSATDVGLGMRFTYNFSPSFAVDSEADSFFTNINNSQKSLQFGGRAILGVVGPKAGIHGRKYGVFFKARPGFLDFDGPLNSASLFGSLATKHITHAVLDLGVASEFYPSDRTILRLDVGAILVRYGDATLFSVPTPNGVFSVRSTGSINAPWHVEVGAGYRLGNLQKKAGTTTASSHLQVGVQYSVFTLQRSNNTVRDESGIGCWANWDFTRYFGLDSTLAVFPRKVQFIDFQQGGRIIQAVVGLRGGVRRGRVGVFGKFRPGVQIYTDTLANETETGSTHFADVAFDVGGIIEVYTSPHTLLRFDAGDTIVLYRGRDVITVGGAPLHISSFVNATIQLTGGFGFRF